MVLVRGNTSKPHDKPSPGDFPIYPVMIFQGMCFDLWWIQICVMSHGIIGFYYSWKWVEASPLPSFWDIPTLCLPAQYHLVAPSLGTQVQGACCTTPMLCVLRAFGWSSRQGSGPFSWSSSSLARLLPEKKKNELDFTINQTQAWTGLFSDQINVSTSILTTINSEVITT